MYSCKARESFAFFFHFKRVRGITRHQTTLYIFVLEGLHTPLTGGDIQADAFEPVAAAPKSESKAEALATEALNEEATTAEKPAEPAAKAQAEEKDDKKLKKSYAR